MKLVKLKDLFEIKRGVNLIFSNYTLDNNGIPFVSRTGKNNGICGYITEINNIIPNPANTISVASSGSVGSAFLQTKPYYSGNDIYVLTPQAKMTKDEMLAYCVFIEHNKYKYSYGRQMNKTLRELLVPSFAEMKSIIPKIKTNKLKKDSSIHIRINLKDCKWEYFRLETIFDQFERGKEIIANSDNKGDIPLISSTSLNNGVHSKINNGKKIFKAPCITVANNGSVCSSFFQNHKFYATSDVTVLQHQKLNFYNACFLITILEQEKYRFNYGRKFSNTKMKNLKIKLPIDNEGKLNWWFMENYIKSLPCSSNLK
ncbi:restriction endonuclease subunit S [Candidatus Phytoplasma meliae]|uniref:Restriction endonuclease subunit S n=1 Tax=Candidatus Phytoplasma meliae TaxID=1848402 RepID=A0ABS5CZ68_9MOLU|nr:restriction endonuclease subunit S [Candidatus Phytoplasma meliae]MBP5836281.1 restriction endonuclease subunit S [Candidatus Phytoplasma meliae]